jgi:pyridoxal phosphate enzyme (YggS family)
MDIIKNYILTKNLVKSISKSAEIIVVTKNQNIDLIKNIVDQGHLHFGENKVQEALLKWKLILENNNSLMLHLVGNLQTNKVADALKIFSFIHSLDREKLAISLKKEEDKISKKIKYFIQINLEKELHKSGIYPTEACEFIDYCKNELNLNIVGLMCVPPVESDPELYFKQLREIAIKKSLSQLSMGMSNDFQVALRSGATHVRIGSAIFGARL